MGCVSDDTEIVSRSKILLISPLVEFCPFAQGTVAAATKDPFAKDQYVLGLLRRS